MDNVCHSLVGAALAQAGLKRWSARATSTLVVAANLPDVDGVTVFMGRSLELRRGLTHGWPALILWPFILAGLMVLWDRARRSPDPARFGPLVAVSAIGVLTHSFLDYLNNYGLRWLMPLEDRWFYGDSLFIIDPWLLIVLALGIVLVRRSEKAGQSDPAKPARVALAVATVYIGAMMASTMVARSAISRELAAVGATPTRLMVNPVPINPFVKEVVVDEGTSYRRGSYRFLAQPSLVLDRTIDKGLQFAPRFDPIKLTRAGRAFFHWSRLPVLTETGAYDLRYARAGGTGFATLALPPKS